MTAQHNSYEELSGFDTKDMVIRQAHMLWCLGDWHPLLALIDKWDTKHRYALIPYKISALLQIGNSDQAKTLLASIDYKQTDRALVTRLLIAGTINSLGKAKACNFEHEQANKLFRESLDVGLAYTAEDTLCQARTTAQLAQLGLPNLWSTKHKALFKPNIEYLLNQLVQIDPDNPYLHIGLAEAAISKTDYQSAIIEWQAVVAGMGLDTPQMYYDRLKYAYDKAGRYPLASEEEEALRGDKDKHELLLEIQRQLMPSLYFEIGVESGKSLSLAKCDAIGVDPMPRVSHKLGEQAKIIVSTSDRFFSTEAGHYLTKNIDLAFIDGMHLFEFALRDFINVEKHCSDQALIIIDDIYPGHEAQADRDRRTRAWTGDVWKLHKILTQYRPDLFIATLDVYPTGLMLIAGLDRTNRVLNDKYDEVTAALKGELIPGEYIARSGAWSGNDGRISKLINVLNDAKVSNKKTKELVVILSEVNGMADVNH